MGVLPRADDCALLLVDLQVGAVSSVRTKPAPQLKDNAIALATLARMHGIPAVLTASRKAWCPGVPELKALLQVHAFVERSQVAAFDDRAVHEAIAATGRNTIITAGVATDIGLLYTALSAKADGFGIVAVLDASGTTDRLAEEIARQRLLSESIGITGWASLATGLMRDFAGPQGLDTMALLSQRMNGAENPF